MFPGSRMRLVVWLTALQLAACTNSQYRHAQRANVSAPRRLQRRLQEEDPWRFVREAIDLLPQASVFVAVGNGSGVVFEHGKGSTTRDSVLTIFSASKWLAASAIAGVVAEGRSQLELDTEARVKLEWWTAAEGDPRRGVTLRQLLGFVSGFGRVSGGMPGSGCGGSASYLDCAKVCYESTYNAAVEPGELYQYNSVHLKLAGAMASAATGLTAQALASKYVMEKAGIDESSCRWASSTNPEFAAGLQCSVAEYSKFMTAYFGEGSRTLWPQGESARWRDEMEKDQFPLAERTPFDQGWHCEDDAGATPAAAPAAAPVAHTDHLLPQQTALATGTTATRRRLRRGARSAGSRISTPRAARPASAQ